MRLIEFNRRPTPRQLREFGVVCLVALPLIAWLWGASMEFVLWLGLSGLLIALLGLSYPPALRPLFIGLSFVTVPIGMLLGELILLTIFVVFFAPLAVLFRIMRRDALQLRMERDCTSYWQPKKQPPGAASYFRQS